MSLLRPNKTQKSVTRETREKVLAIASEMKESASRTRQDAMRWTSPTLATETGLHPHQNGHDNNSAHAQNQNQSETTVTGADTETDIRTIIQNTIQAEFQRIREDGARYTEDAPQRAAPTYAAAAMATPPAGLTPTPAFQPNKPAIILTPKTAVKDSADTLDTWKRNISFRGTSFAPSSAKFVSNNKVRVEFDTLEQRDKALSMTNDGNYDVMAESSKTLAPMVILKGVPADIQEEQLTDIIINQNPNIAQVMEQEQDLTLHFKRNNRNPRLYNAIFKTSPRVFREMVTSQKINIDHQKVHACEHLPLLQCYKCLQYGHTRKRCTSEHTNCSHCASPEHEYRQCPVWQDNTRLQCHNCTTHANKNNIRINTKHSATSATCPRMSMMSNKIRQRIDYG
jgi:hypothetical protein